MTLLSPLTPGGLIDEMNKACLVACIARLKNTLLFHGNWDKKCKNMFLKFVFSETRLKPSHTAAITDPTQREGILLVELLHAEYTHAHSTN